jgi:hypothetical protein
MGDIHGAARALEQCPATSIAFLQHRVRMSDIPEYGGVITFQITVIFVDRFLGVFFPHFKDHQT